MADDFVRIKALKGDVAAEVEIPLDKIINALGDWGQIENVLSSLYNAIDRNVKRAHDRKNDANANSSKLESVPEHNQPVETLKRELDDQDEPAEYKSLSQILKNDSGWREVERLLIIIFYASNYGRADVTREDIISAYKEIGKDTLSRKRNMSNFLQTLRKYQWIMASEEEKVYYMTDEGIFRAKGILARGKAPVKDQD
jgi:hypothetical protein